MFPITVVRVMVATRRALVETGDMRSPTYAPERMAPPMSTGSTPIVTPIVMQITPMVAAVPNDVPVSSESRALSRNAARIIVRGLTAYDA